MPLSFDAGVTPGAERDQVRGVVCAALGSGDDVMGVQEVRRAALDAGAVADGVCVNGCRETREVDYQPEPA